MKKINPGPTVRVFRIVMPIMAIASVVIFVPWQAIWARIAPLPDSVQGEVDRALDDQLDGIIVYVDRPGEAPAFYTAGWKDKLAQVPADPHALFRIASISKLYIAAAVAKLVSSGSLSLDATLANYLPDLAGRIEHADRITLRMMVGHRSGIPNFTDQAAFDWFIPHTDIDTTLALALDLPAGFEPGARYSYSNTNYLLIGRILDSVLGYSHQQYIADEILAPLGLTHTYSVLGEAEYADVVSGYWLGYDDDLRQLDYVIPGGSMVATAPDVAVFLRALIDGSLLSGAEQAIYSSIYDYEHTGWLPGYYSIARYHPDIDAVVIQFVSTTGGETILISDAVYDRIVRIVREGVEDGR